MMTAQSSGWAHCLDTKCVCVEILQEEGESVQSVEAFWRAVNLAVLPGSAQEAPAHRTMLPGTGATQQPQDLNATQGPGHPPLPPVQDFHPTPSFSQDHT